ncbi:MAG: 3-dehydroquinate synthase [Acutalibacteraceae bacterium]|nr:3-dehydroquinate synthase [Acutalibacteraceae bacterium]
MKLNVSNSYDIIIQRGAVSDCAKYIKQVARGTKCAVISDSNVIALYGKTVIDSLKQEGFDVCSFSFEAGEKSKVINTVIQMVEFLSRSALTRYDTVIALGGGVTGDMAGFAASMYLRGIDFVGIPTSLLAQIDSSVGGKTGCDLRSGKNLVGAFYNPKLVLIDPDTLNSLPNEFLSDGMAEAIKCSCIKSEELFCMIEKATDFSFIDDMIYSCVSIKKQVVENDFKENGERALLNFGHTLGHAIEKLQNFCGLSHGCAVSVGMNYVVKACEKNGMCEKDTAQRLEAICKKYNLPVSVDIDLKEICDACYNDKKRADDKIKLITISKIGQSQITETQCDKLYEFIKE